MKWKLVKYFILIAVLVMAIIPLLYQTKVEVTVTDADIEDKTKVVKKQPQPKHSVNLPDFAAIKDAKQKKQQFFDFLKPAVHAENERLIRLRKQLVDINVSYQQSAELNEKQTKHINALSKRYGIKQTLNDSVKINKLLSRVDMIPHELVLVQAANESAWGTSRFARMGLNFFGMWCFKKGCGLVPQGRDSGLNHEVASFSSVEQMVSRYFHNINTNRAYGLFREIRGQLRDNELELKADILATGLLPYSERGIDYIVEINTMLRHNARYL